MEKQVAQPSAHVESKPCLVCGVHTFMDDQICPVCSDPPVIAGLFPCCGGLAPEHRGCCNVGAAIAAARWSIARAGVKRRKVA